MTYEIHDCTCCLRIKGSSGNSGQKLKRTLAYRYSFRVTWKSQYILEWEQKYVKFPAALFTNYCHRCLPLNWPRLSQHALLVSGSYNGCLQLFSKRGRDSATYLQGKCHSHAPLASASPVVWRKMYSLLRYWWHRHLNSSHSSFLLCPHCLGWPHNWIHACGQISGGESTFIITGCGDHEVGNDCFMLRMC